MDEHSSSIRSDPDDLAYWFPILQGTGVPIPKTEIVETDLDLLDLLDGKDVPGFDGLVHEIDAAGRKVGAYPFFLRTGHGSGKHQWHDTCFVGQPTDLASNVARLVDWSYSVDFLGLPTSTWVAREFLELRVAFHAFNGMPIAREFRTFVRDHSIQCIHPYWPTESITAPDAADWEYRLAAMNYRSVAEENLLVATAGAVADGFEGYWSVDIAQTAKGEWLVTDMATGDRSFHWAGCPFGPPPEPSRQEPDWESMLERAIVESKND